MVIANQIAGLDIYITDLYIFVYVSKWKSFKRYCQQKHSVVLHTFRIHWNLIMKLIFLHRNFFLKKYYSSTECIYCRRHIHHTTVFRREASSRWDTQHWRIHRCGANGGSKDVALRRRSGPKNNHVLKRCQLTSENETAGNVIICMVYVTSIIPPNH